MQLLISFLIVILLLALRSPVRLLVFLSKWINELKKSDLIKARQLCNIFRFIGDLNSINDDGEFQSSCSNICPEELQLGKENTDNQPL